MRDESAIHVGSRGTVEYLPDILSGESTVEIVVREIHVNPKDGRLYAKCGAVGDPPDGDYRWFRLDEVTPVEGET